MRVHYVAELKLVFGSSASSFLCPSLRHGRVARQRVPATQKLLSACLRARGLSGCPRGVLHRGWRDSGWPVRAAARRGHDEFCEL